jgi:hypothetical protein
MTPEELQAIQTQAQTEIEEQGHSATPYALAIIELRDAVSHYANGVIWNPQCSGCLGLQSRADSADRDKRMAESALSATVAEVARMRDIMASADTEATTMRGQLADLEAQVFSLQGENASHLDTITTLQAEIATLQEEP